LPSCHRLRLLSANGTTVVSALIKDGAETEFDAIALAEDFITAADVEAVGAEFSDLTANTVTINNDPLADGHFDATLNIVMPQVFQAP